MPVQGKAAAVLLSPVLSSLPHAQTARAPPPPLPPLLGSLQGARSAGNGLCTVNALPNHAAHIITVRLAAATHALAWVYLP